MACTPAPNGFITSDTTRSLDTAVTGIDPEEDHEHRRHQRAAAHAGEPDDDAHAQATEGHQPIHDLASPGGWCKRAEAHPAIESTSLVGIIGLANPPGPIRYHRPMRISAKADYAVRLAAELAAAPPATPVTGPALASAQNAPLAFCENILGSLRTAGIVQSRRGAEGGYLLARPPADVTVADVIRAVDGPLGAVHGDAPENVTYLGPAARLADVWIAARASLRDVLERVTLADLAAGRLPGPGREARLHPRRPAPSLSTRGRTP